MKTAPMKKKAHETEVLALAQERFHKDAVERRSKAQKHYEAQDDDTQEAIDRMAAMLEKIARRQMWVRIGENKVVSQIDAEDITMNMFYMANEIIKDLAVMDVKVANYKFPGNLCAECGTEIKLTKKPTKKGTK